jgi:hypothetical protein
MKAIVLCIVTASVTGLHNFYWLMNVVNGAPVPLLNLIALLGSATLLGAALLLSLRRRGAAAVGLVGSVMLWVFYAPLMVISLLMPFSALQEIQSYTKFHEYVPLFGMLVGPLLLIICTINLALLFRRSLSRD